MLLKQERLGISREFLPYDYEFELIDVLHIEEILGPFDKMFMK